MLSVELHKQIPTAEIIFTARRRGPESINKNGNLRNSPKLDATDWGCQTSRLACVEKPRF
jgi:hypothetical protein